MRNRRIIKQLFYIVGNTKIQYYVNADEKEGQLEYGGFHNDMLVIYGKPPKLEKSHLEYIMRSYLGRQGFIYREDDHFELYKDYEFPD